MDQRFFGAHKYRRTCYAGDYSGRAILHTLAVCTFSGCWYTNLRGMPALRANFSALLNVALAPRSSAAPSVESPLSNRERDVLRLVGEGLPSKQIGRELSLAERTVKAHVTGAMNKLGAFSRAQALGIAIERHYL